LKRSIKVCALLFVSAALFGAVRPAQAATGNCDRSCLIHTMDNYIAALVAHDPSKVNFAPDVKFVENIERIKPGEGLWKTASAPPTTFKIYVPDPVSEQVGLMCMMQENGKPIQLVVRLKLENGKIVEAEHLIARNLREASLKNLETPRPGLLAKVPPSERVPRAEMLKIGASYYTALTTANGKAAPFAADCERHENGMQTTGVSGPNHMPPMGCEEQLNTHVFDYITKIEPRRVNIADPETGLVLGLSQFRQPMEQTTEKIVGVKGVDTVPMNFKPFDLPAAHIFKISGGKIHEIEAMGFTAPYNSKTGWE
jgi:hypothetical protein